MVESLYTYGDSPGPKHGYSVLEQTSTARSTILTAGMASFRLAELLLNSREDESDG